jgi:hypothetical protein
MKSMKDVSECFVLSNIERVMSLSLPNTAFSDVWKVCLCRDTKEAKLCEGREVISTSHIVIIDIAWLVSGYQGRSRCKWLGQKIGLFITINIG